MAYAAGNQRAGFDVVTAVHVKGCAHCQREVALMESVGAAGLAEAETATLDPSALARTLARLDEPAPALKPAPTLAQLLTAAKRRWVAPGVWVAKIDTPHAPEDRVYMLSAAPGAATALHSHQGAEFTQVLSGALDDEGVVYEAGDFCERDSAHVHQPKTVGAIDCVCLFATHGRLAPQGVIGRIAFMLADV